MLTDLLGDPPVDQGVTREWDAVSTTPREDLEIIGGGQLVMHAMGVQEDVEVEGKEYVLSQEDVEEEDKEYVLCQEDVEEEDEEYVLSQEDVDVEGKEYVLSQEDVAVEEEGYDLIHVLLQKDAPEEANSFALFLLVDLQRQARCMEKQFSLSHAVTVNCQSLLAIL
uniref:Uncharacterized protein n=1 Tax=Sphaerodactylus townsendi TaxID=933632 RepID=A0ACB8G6M9_9SAUR